LETITICILILRLIIDHTQRKVKKGMRLFSTIKTIFLIISILVGNEFFDCKVLDKADKGLYWQPLNNACSRRCSLPVGQQIYYQKCADSDEDSFEKEISCNKFEKRFCQNSKFIILWFYWF
jgi:hypothetical protein